MYQNTNQQKRYNSKLSSQKLKVPELKSKAYSFADPLLQSFGNYNSNEFPYHHKNLILTKKEVQIDSQMFSQLQEFSNRMSLMSRILNINKAITNPSVLMINSQNKMKTKMLIDSKRLNNDQNSIILCENANKYLTFLDVLSEEQNQHQNEFCMMKESFENDVKYNLQSRTRGERQNNRKQKEVFEQYVSDSFDSRHLVSNPKTTNFSSGLSTAEKMFQGIKTPQHEVNQQSLEFTPLRQPKKYQGQFTNLQTEGKKTKNVKSPQSSAVLQVKNNPPKIQEPQIHMLNQKMKQSNNKSPAFKNQNQESEVSRSKSKNERAKQNQIKEKKTSTKDFKETKKNRSFTNIESMFDSKNLAYKTLDKTSQFQKMLKMASSRMNPN